LRPDTNAQTIIPALAEKFRGAANDQLKSIVEEQKTQMEAFRATQLTARKAKRYEKLKAKVRELAEACDSLSEQYDQKAAELCEVAKLKDELADRVAKLSAVVEDYENSSKRNTVSDAIAPLAEIHLSAVHDIVENASLSSIEKARQIVPIVNAAVKRNGVDEARIGALTAVVSGVFRFLTTLSSREDLKPLFGSIELSVCKRFLVTQIQRLDSFMREHAISLVEDSSLFEVMLRKSDRSSVLDAVERFAPNSTEDHPLFLALMQAVGANDILRKFCADAAETVATQTREIRDLRKGLSDLRHRREADQQQTVAEADQAVHNAVDSVRSVLRQAVTSGHPSLAPIVESLDRLEPVAPVGDAQYVQSLEKRVLELETALAKSEQSVAEVAQAKETTQCQIERAEMRMAEILKEAEAEKARLIGDKCEAEAQANALLRDFSSVEQANRDLKQEKAIVQQKLADLEAAARRSLAELEKTFESAQADCFRLVELKENRIRQIEAELARVKGKTLDRERRYRASLLGERNERNALEMQLQENLAYKTRQLDAEKLAEEVERLEAELRVLAKRLLSKDQEQQSEMELLQLQLNLKIANAEAEAQAKVEESERKCRVQNQNFLLSACKLFNSYFDVRVPITVEVAEAVLRKVREDLDAQQSLQRAKILLDEVKRILNAEDERDVLRITTELVESREERGEIQILRQKIRKLTTWIERMFALCGGLFMGTGNLQEMKRTIEQTLRRKTIDGQERDDRPSRGKADLSGSHYAFD
jgi:hypothetical protein